MKRNKLLTLLSLVPCLWLQAQMQPIQGKIATKDTADLTILQVVPDSFPNISVIFKAESRKGHPVWGLTKDMMTVKEDEASCQVISLAQISKKTPIHLSIVIDHSGSMLEDLAQLYSPSGLALFDTDLYGNILYPKGYVAPIDAAKEAVKQFLGEFDFGKDDVTVIGFSSLVDKVSKRSQDPAYIKDFVDGMEADFGTAFYDALQSSLNELEDEKGLKVVIALTDGGDNSSRIGWRQVVKNAKKADIPIYTIGLGTVLEDTLRQIAEQTKGRYFYSRSSSSLNDIYAGISEQVNAFYELVYASPNMEVADTNRTIALHFDVDSLYLESHAMDATLPSAILEATTARGRTWEWLVVGGSITAVLAAAGVIVVRRRRKAPEAKLPPQILSAYPNPTNGVVHVDYGEWATTLKVVNTLGFVVRTLPIQPTGGSYDLGGLPMGTYILILDANGVKSNPVRVVLVR